MKTLPILTLIWIIALASPAQPVPGQPRPPIAPARPPQAEPAKDPVNYLIRVEWKEPKGEPKFLEILTTEGNFSLDTIQKNSVKINGNEIPSTLKFSGDLTDLNGEKGRLRLFLGRTVPYVTGSYGSGAGAQSSYSQLSVGLNSTFVVQFGKSQVIQSDENGIISVLVTRVDK